jgi:hypothetical protein
VRKRGLEPLCLLGASTSSWCVCQFRHLRTGVEQYEYSKGGEGCGMTRGGWGGCRIGEGCPEAGQIEYRLARWVGSMRALGC